MFGPAEMHLFDRVGKGAQRRVINLAGGGSGIGLLILGKRRTTREEDGTVLEKIGAETFPLQVEIPGRGEQPGVWIVKLSMLGRRPSMATGCFQHQTIGKESRRVERPTGNHVGSL